jgi:hypothetical protein
VKSIRVFYFDRRPNFGDQLNVCILERLFNVKAEKHAAESADLIAIGSMLQGLLWTGPDTLRFYFDKYLRRKPIAVYGSGFIAAPGRLMRKIRVNGLPETFFRRLKPFALRGRVTKARVESICRKTYDDLPLGDPGLLASLLIDRPGPKRYAIGFVPHYVDKTHPRVVELLAQVPHSTLIDVEQDPLRVIEQIAQCDTVVSTSLHGLVAADALGVPSQWAVVSDKIAGGGYKFQDYYSVFDLEPEPWDLNRVSVTDIRPEAIAEGYRVDRGKVAKIQQRLLASFPYR